MSYNNGMSRPPEYQTIRIWMRTLRALRLVAALTGERLVAALTGERMVQVLDRPVAKELKRIQEQERREDV